MIASHSSHGIKASSRFEGVTSMLLFMIRDLYGADGCTNYKAMVCNKCMSQADLGSILGSALERTFQNVFTEVRNFAKTSLTSAFSYDIKDQVDAYIYNVKVPGVPREAITLTLHTDIRTLDICASISPGSCQCTTTISLQRDADVEHITASLNLGVLTVHVSKLPVDVRISNGRPIPIS